jgi:uncharacterized damage-inducible protein DinB
MSLKSQTLEAIEETRRYFDRTSRCLGEADSGLRATPETRTVAQQVAHTAQVIDWFREGAFEDRWNLDIPALDAETALATSLTAAREELAAAWKRLAEQVEAAGDAGLAAPMQDNPILGSRPRHTMVQAIVDHTAHHRGALAVYARLAGRTPEMPYGTD